MRKPSKIEPCEREASERKIRKSKIRKRKKSEKVGQVVFNAKRKKGRDASARRNRDAQMMAAVRFIQWKAQGGRANGGLELHTWTEWPR